MKIKYIFVALAIAAMLPLPAAHATEEETAETATEEDAAGTGEAAGDGADNAENTDSEQEDAAPAPAAEMLIPSPAAMPSAAIPTVKKVELIDGSWALVDGNSVKISKDQGRNWTPAPNETWVAKDGSKLVTKNGKIVR